MEFKQMKILVIEDDIDDCNLLKSCANYRDDIEIVAITNSDIEGLNLIKIKKPDGVILDIELNNSLTGSTDSIEMLKKVKELDYKPIIIVTTHINSRTTYKILHRNGVDLILYKEQPNFSYEHVFNSFIEFEKSKTKKNLVIESQKTEEYESKISNLINNELELIGINSKLQGRKYLHDAIMLLIKDEKANIITDLTKKYKKSPSTITNGIQNAIIHAWRITPIEDLEKYYKARINYETGIPTPMEFIYYYVEKIKKRKLRFFYA